MLTSTRDASPDQFLLSTLPPGGQQKRLAALVLLVLLLALVITVPFARTPLADTEVLLPAYATAVLLTDLITSALLFALYSVQPSRALLALSIGYLFAALTVVPWALTFPGVFAPSGLLGAGLQSTASIAAVRRVGFSARGPRLCRAEGCASRPGVARVGAGGHPRQRSRDRSPRVRADLAGLNER